MAEPPPAEAAAEDEEFPAAAAAAASSFLPFAYASKNASRYLESVTRAHVARGIRHEKGKSSRAWDTFCKQSKKSENGTSAALVPCTRPKAFARYIHVDREKKSAGDEEQEHEVDVKVAHRHGDKHCAAERDQDVVERREGPRPHARGQRLGDQRLGHRRFRAQTFFNAAAAAAAVAAAAVLGGLLRGFLLFTLIRCVVVAVIPTLRNGLFCRHLAGDCGRCMRDR